MPCATPWSDSTQEPCSLTDAPLDPVTDSSFFSPHLTATSASPGIPPTPPRWQTLRVVFSNSQTADTALTPSALGGFGGNGWSHLTPLQETFSSPLLLSSIDLGSLSGANCTALSLGDLDLAIQVVGNTVIPDGVIAWVGSDTWTATTAVTTWEIRPPTPEEVAQAEAQRARLAVISKRADRLLVALLTSKQKAMWLRLGYILIPSAAMPGVVYKLPRQGMVGVYEEGHHVMDLCIHGNDALPLGDRIVSMKLLIEAEEAELHEIANVHRLTHPGARAAAFNRMVKQARRAA